jgi:SAM-dependent methyltransferase
MTAQLVATAASPLAKIKDWIPRSIKRFMLLRILSADLEPGARASRQWFEREVLPILPRLGFKRIMFVGTAPYTHHYERIARRAGGEWMTCDVNPSAAVWGARWHAVARIQEIDKRFPPETFDAVILCGVLGFGIDTEPDLDAATIAIWQVLRPAGLLLLGWNSDAAADPLRADVMRSFYRPATALPLPSRRSFDQEAFVYDFQIRVER